MTASNIFGTFHGANLQRLVKCLNKVCDEGLSVDEHTQAGINEHSGNVWVWSENWSGCVYCSLSGTVAWCYSCPECGEEHSFDTEAECAEYASKHDGQCEACFVSEAIDGEA